MVKNLVGWFVGPIRYPNTQLFLPSGIAVLAIEEWAERLAKAA